MKHQILINANHISKIKSYPETETKYKWFLESEVIIKRFFWFKNKVKIESGWGLEEATSSNVQYIDYYGTLCLDKPERLSIKEMESRNFKLRRMSDEGFLGSKWYTKAKLEVSFLNNGIDTYYFDSNEELDEILTELRSLNHNLVDIKK